MLNVHGCAAIAGPTLLIRKSALFCTANVPAADTVRKIPDKPEALNIAISVFL
jgi:hypothetical protein